MARHGPDAGMIPISIGDVKVYFFYLPDMTSFSATRSKVPAGIKKTATAGAAAVAVEGLKRNYQRIAMPTSTVRAPRPLPVILPKLLALPM